MPIVTRDYVKTYLGLSGTTYDERIDMLIPIVEADYLLIRNAAFDTHDNEELNYPDDSQVTSSLMIGFHLNNKPDGMKSETIGSYSYTKEEITDGYPKSIARRIKRFHKLQ